MPRVKIGQAQPDRKTLDVEIARLRDLDVGVLRARWHTVLRRRPPPTCLAICCSACWLTGFRPIPWGTWMAIVNACSIARSLLRKPASTLWTWARPGTVLGREWNGQMQRVVVLADGFAWKGKTYPSLSKVAFAITGTRWNGPKFFGLRDKPTKGRSP
jgi:Protein of unknown function (DUF2924)